VNQSSIVCKGLGDASHATFTSKDSRILCGYHLLNANTGEEMPFDNDDVGIPAAYSPGGDQLACISGTTIWIVPTTPSCTRLRSDSTDCEQVVVISSTAALIASGTRDGLVYLWDVKSGKQRSVLRKGTSSVTALRFSPDESTVAVGTYDGFVRVWHTITSRFLWERRATEADSDTGVVEIWYSTDGCQVNCMSYDRILEGDYTRLERAWTTKEGHTLSCSFKGASCHRTNVAEDVWHLSEQTIEMAFTKGTAGPITAWYPTMIQKSVSQAREHIWAGVSEDGLQIIFLSNQRNDTS